MCLEEGMSIPDLSFPHQDYKMILMRLVGYFRNYPSVYAIVLIGSVARGKAVEGSCIDLFVSLTKSI
ncbi:MAG TPA: nucleotidyltransferase domain-containing protein [Acidobacteriota bacterium]|nr:nucleotidyltransferase domain-containing protein [Acidobacteriota bacterium]